MARTLRRKRKEAPKSALKLPDLEQSKSAVLNSLTSVRRDLTIMPSASSSDGAVRNRGWLQQDRREPDTESRSSSDITLDGQPKTCVSTTACLLGFG